MTKRANAQNWLFKYKPWNKHTQAILEKNEFWFTSPKDFNDPFDCAIELDVRGGTRGKRRDRIEIHLKESRPWLTKNQVYDIATWRAKQPAFAERNPDAYNRWLHNYAADHWGILSLSWIKDNILMWSHYAKDHQGVCIALDVNAVNRAMVEYLDDPRLLLYREDVKYAKSYPRRNYFELNDPGMLDFCDELMITKSEQWSYEREHRAVIMALPGVDAIGEAERAITMPADTIAAVHIGLKASADTRSEICQILKQRDDKIRLYEAKRKRGKYELTFNQVAYRT